MRSFQPLISFFLLLLTFDFVSAATKEQWRGKSIYQLLTDRFAPVSDTAPARTDGIPEVCDGALQTWCGGTWRSIIDKLDYIQGMGMDAIWISPVAKNIDLQTPYHFAYHGYWVIDPHELNPRFGTEDDLHDLVTAVHARGMYIMVDIVINNIPSLAVDEALHPDQLEAVGSYWTKTEQFHPQCWIDYSNATSVEYCWLGDDKLPLMDVNTEDQEVIDTLQAYIKNFVQEYKIDGLRIDAAKHVPGHFWQGFCGAAGVFCIGEVYGSDMGFAAQYQVQNWMDSVLGYPLYYGLTAGFGTPMGNMTHFVDIANQVMTTFPDPSIIGNFIENHDLPRWRNVTVDPQLAYNALVASFIFEGLPVVYYGQEQDISEGMGDPYNRNALWPYGYSNTSTYWHIAQLNQVRHALISNGTKFEDKTFLDYPSKIIASTNSDVAIRKGPLLAVLTNRGSPSQAATFGVKNTGWPSQSSVIDIFSCKQYIVGADQSVTVSYAESGYGGMPYVFLSSADAQALHVCGTGITAVVTSTSNNNKNDGNSNNAAKTESHQSSASHTLAKVVDQPVGMLGVGVLILVAAGTFGSWFA